MTLITLSLLILIFYVVLVGNLTAKFLLKTHHNDLSFSEIGFLGLSSLIFISFIIHFFLPLNIYVNTVLFLIIIFISLKDIDKILRKIFLKKELILFFFIALLLTIFQKPHEDYGYYHLPYLVNIVSDKVIFGLSNLQSNFAWNSSWLNASALFNIFFLKLKSTVLINSILYFFILNFFYENIFYNKKLSVFLKFFTIFFSFYFLLKFTRLTEYGFDVAANFFLFLIIYNFIKYFEKEKVLNFKLLLIFSSIAVTIKLTTFVGLLISLLAIYLFIKKNNFSKFIDRNFFFCLLLILFWLIQQFIYSGCFVPFFFISCVEYAGWYSESIISSIENAIGVFNKSYSSYNGILTKEEYVANFNWVPTWFNRIKVQALEHLITLLGPIIFLFFLNVKKIKFKKVNLILFKSKIFQILLISSVIGILIWFLKSPVMRFGIIYFYILIFLLIYLFCFNLLEKNSVSEKSFKIVFFICLLFVVVKNFNRVSSKYDEKTVWPHIPDITVSENIRGKFKIHSPVSKEHQSNYCWATPFVCSISDPKKLVFLSKNGYTFILKNN